MPVGDSMRESQDLVLSVMSVRRWLCHRFLLSGHVKTVRDFRSLGPTHRSTVFSYMAVTGKPFSRIRS